MFSGKSNLFCSKENIIFIIYYFKFYNHVFFEHTKMCGVCMVSCYYNQSWFCDYNILKHIVDELVNIFHKTRYLLKIKTVFKNLITI